MNKSDLRSQLLLVMASHDFTKLFYCIAVVLNVGGSEYPIVRPVYNHSIGF